MAGGSLLALLDDIASILDDVSLLTKVAAKKTTGVLGDDLALNAQQVAGIRADRELPVVWAVFKGSLRNKLILVPSALAVSALAPWAITPLLMLGGAFLCFEGFEKLAHAFSSHDDADGAHRAELARALADPSADLMAIERDKIRGAVRTDFILSAEIVVITLGTVTAAPLGTQIAVLAGVAALMTVGVYGLVAGIVKLDDAGLYLSRPENGFSPPVRSVGRGILRAAPLLMKTLSVVGTAAMFLVGGGILVHGLPPAHGLVHAAAEAAAALPAAGALLARLAPLVVDALVGVVAGALLLGGVAAFRRLVR
ncbi:MAG: DUF808 domain-containing protein [Betaproteobacteria bacterium]|nr:DUF808 domain-containing protein [Betaproteobacteria bacterium]